MLPGERIDLIQKIAAELGDPVRDWEDVDLILRQFGFPTSEEAGSSPRGYVINMIERADATELVALDEYLSGGVTSARLDAADLPWEPGTFRLFVSHTHPNAALCDQMKSQLGRWRIDAFVAHTTIEPTREWQREIELALESCHAAMVLLTPDLIESAWCDQEIGYCIARKVPIVPLRMGVDPHGFIGKYQAATPQKPEDGRWLADTVFRALASHGALQDMMANPTVHRFAATTSFDGARVNFKLLSAIPEEAWSRELVELAERATNDNRQLSEAGVLEPQQQPLPEALEEVLKPIRERLGMDEPAASVSDDDIPF